MALAMIVFGLVLVSIPGLCHRAGRRLRSSEWARLSIVGLVAGAIVFEFGLVLLATPTVLRAVGVEAFAAACSRVVGPLIPFGDLGGWISASMAVLTALLAVREVRRTSHAESVAWIEPCVGEHRHDGAGFELVVLPVEASLAYSVSSPTPQIVVSSGFAARLNADEFEVVLAHERAHLRLGHHRRLCAGAIAGASVAWWPPAWRSHRVARIAHERWADDEATGDDATRRRRLASVLERVACDPPPLAAMALSPLYTVAERIVALNRAATGNLARPSAALRVALYIPGGILGAAALGAFSVWITQAQFVLALAGRCPLQA